MKIVTFVGARPQFIKAGVLRRKFDSLGIDEKLVHSGQHYDADMSDVFFDQMKIRKPDYNMTLSKRSHAGMTAEMLIEFERILQIEKPEFCLVYGDTNSTLAGALSAAKLGVRIIHVEAGLRSFNRAMPEEINRVLTDHLSTILFCPTEESVKNLKAENVKTGVYNVGDIMYDASSFYNDVVNIEEFFPADIRLDTSKKLACMTIHRQENVESEKRLRKVVEYAKEKAQEFEIIFPTHPNTKKKLAEYNIDTAGLVTIPPQSYLAMQSIMRKCDLVLTDSGGLQKEAYFNGVRTITIRSETEWVETISHGWNRLWTSEDYACDTRPIADYGQGDSAEKICSVLMGDY